MALPSWVAPEPETIRENCGLEPHQLFALLSEDDEAKMLALIAGHIEHWAAYMWSEARRATGANVSFPSTPVELRLAFPIEIPDDADEDETDDMEAAYTADIAAQIAEQKNNAALIVSSFVLAKLWYAVSGDEAQAKAGGHWKDAQILLSTLKKSLAKVRRSYLANTRPAFV